jgi:hypothetical protein
VRRVIVAVACVHLAVVPALELSGATADVAAMEQGAPNLPAGSTLPPFTGEDLTGAKVTLPDAARGQVTLIAFGFSYESRKPVEAWSAHLRERFGANDQFAWYQVPMVGGIGRLAKPFIMNGMRKQSRPNPRNSVIVFGGVGPWKKRLGVKDDGLAYLVLLDRGGVVRWQHAGDFDAGTAVILDTRVQNLLASPTAR